MVVDSDLFTLYQDEPKYGDTGQKYPLGGKNTNEITNYTKIILVSIIITLNGFIIRSCTANPLPDQATPEISYIHESRCVTLFYPKIAIKSSLTTQYGLRL